MTNAAPRPSSRRRGVMPWRRQSPRARTGNVSASRASDKQSILKCKVWEARESLEGDVGSGRDKSRKRNPQGVEERRETSGDTVTSKPGKRAHL